jgi:hypothetical protein
MEEKTRTLISRRQFAQRAVVVSATASFVPAEIALGRSAESRTGLQLPDNFPKLSPEGQAEAEARYELLLSRHGTQLSDEQKKNTMMLCSFAQPGLERLRAFSLKNGDVPALFLKPIVERDKAPVSKTAIPPTQAAAKQS